MVKKLKKYVKFVVCCALIFSLMAPSYAALSASDGSAFVTKAEFDSALADFNARLTTFEAGINSKIDSQVTSYLDRNGIWSGKDQNLIEGDRIDLASRLGDSTTTNYWYALSGDATKCKISGNKWDVIGLDLTAPFSKSGLLTLDYEIETKGTGFDSELFSCKASTRSDYDYEGKVYLGYQFQNVTINSDPEFGNGTFSNTLVYNECCHKDLLGSDTSHLTFETGYILPHNTRNTVFGFCSKDTQNLRFLSYAQIKNKNYNWTLTGRADYNAERRIPYSFKSTLILHSVKVY